MQHNKSSDAYKKQKVHKRIKLRSKLVHSIEHHLIPIFQGKHLKSSKEYENMKYKWRLFTQVKMILMITWKVVTKDHKKLS